ncbi:MAG: serine/threonine-protein kinase [Chloroflexota bacterium]
MESATSVSVPIPDKTRSNALKKRDLRLRILLVAAYTLIFVILNTLLPLPYIAGLITVPLTALTFNAAFRWSAKQLAIRQTTRNIPNRLRPNDKEHALRRGALSGKVIGGYEIMNLIDKGGMSEVYTTQSGGLLLAIKIATVNEKSPEFLMRFEREVAMLERAKHPNVVQVFDSGADDTYAYMVMEYIDGVTLKSYIEREGALTIKDVADIVHGLASALEHMHALGIIHRDLKPGNIMLYWDSDGTCVPLLLDFGVAKQSSVTVITLEGTVGTVEYMSPEQILEAPLVQPASDVYAFGVMVYEMLTGELPYDGSMGAIVFGHLHGDTKDPRDINEEVPPTMAAAVCRAMSKDPAQRYDSVSQFAEAMLKDLNN